MGAEGGVRRLAFIGEGGVSGSRFCDCEVDEETLFLSLSASLLQMDPPEEADEPGDGGQTKANC